MSKESTNVELEPITVVGGEIITDGKQKTEIPQRVLDPSPWNRQIKKHPDVENRRITRPCSGFRSE